MSEATLKTAVRYVRFEEATVKALDAVATKDRRTVSETIRIAVEQYLARRGKA